MRSALVIVVCAFSMIAASAAISRQPCPPWPAVNGDGIGPFDYNNPNNATWLRNVDGNHFNHDVRTLRKGQSSAFVGADLHFILHRFPNHHRALDAMMRLSDKEKKARPAGASETLECYLYRAAVFAPEDPIPVTIYGIHLLKLGKRKEALEQLTAAEKLKPDDRNVHYNLGLLYFDEKNYAKSREHAKRAYELGFPLGGLRSKLQSVGAWDG